MNLGSGNDSRYATLLRDPAARTSWVIGPSPPGPGPEPSAEPRGQAFRERTSAHASGQSALPMDERVAPPAGCRGDAGHRPDRRRQSRALHPPLTGARSSVLRPASGMASALDPIMLACGGTWVAHGSRLADRRTVDAAGRVRVPPGGAPLHPAPGLADQGPGGGLLPRPGQRRPLAALPRHLHPAGLRRPTTGRPTARSTSCSPRPSSRRRATGRRSSSSRITTSGSCPGCSRSATPT